MLDRRLVVNVALFSQDEMDHEKQARSEGLASQLESAIAKLEAELAEAKASGDKKKIAEAEEAIAARKVWLGAIGS